MRQLNVRSKTKGQIGMQPYAISTRPNIISPSESTDDVVSAAEECGVLRRGQGQVVRVQTIHHTGDVVAIRHNRTRVTISYWLAVLKEDVHNDVNTNEFVKTTVLFQWLLAGEDHLVYTLGEICDIDSTKCV